MTRSQPDSTSASHIFLTGPPGIGKTTLLQKLVTVIDSSGYQTGGVVSAEIREAGKRTGFTIRDLITGREETMAHKDAESPMRLGNYRVLAQNIDAVCGEAFPYAFQKADVIVVDEVGPMQFFSQGFKHFIKQAIEQDKPVVAVIHPEANQGFVRGLMKQRSTAYWHVSEENRDRLLQRLSEEVLNHL